MRIVGLAASLLAGAANLLALSSGETWLLRSSVILFLAMVAYCLWIASRVNEATKQAQEANAKATALDKRTAAIEEQLGPKD